MTDWANDVAAYIRAIQANVPPGTKLFYECHNESYHGKAARRILGIEGPRRSKGYRRHIRRAKAARPRQDAEDRK